MSAGTSRFVRALRRRLRRRLLALAEKALAKAGFPTNKSGNNMSMR